MRKWVVIALICGAAAVPAPTFAQYVNLLDQTVSAAVDSLVAKAINDNNLPGVTVGIVYDGQIVYTNGYGWARVKKKGTAEKEMTASTVIRWGSLSKSVTAVLALKLVEAGHLELDELVQTHVPEYDHDDVTIRHLLSHQSGTRHYDQGCVFGPYYNGAFDADLTLGIVEQCDLAFTPGTDQRYSSFGFNLLGVVIDRVGQDVYGKGYEALYEDWVKDQLGLLSMTASNSDPDMTTGYSSPGVASTEVPWVGWRLPAGGFSSSIYDLTRYMLGLMRSELITQASSNAMWTAQTLNDGTTTPFGLGVFIDQSSGDLGVWHNGQIPDHSSTLMDFFPNQQVGVAIMTNDGRPLDTTFPMLVQLKQNILDQVRCPASRVFTGGGFWGSDIHYEADNFIEASLSVGDSKIVFDAGNTVRLKPGFRALEGTQFRAMTDGCGGATTPASARVNFDSRPAANQQVVPEKANASPERQPAENLLRIAPNPFSRVVTIEYVVKEASEVSLVLYNGQGTAVRRPLDHVRQPPGVYRVECDAGGLPDGMYLCHLQIGAERVTRKLIKKQ